MTMDVIQANETVQGLQKHIEEVKKQLMELRTDFRRTFEKSVKAGELS